jgi:hypothetical protein
VAGEQKRKERQVLITKALLLGYTIERNTWIDNKGVEQQNGYILVLPNGEILRDSDAKLPAARYYYGRYHAVFPVMWRAAAKALELAGVLPDAKNTR